MKEKDKMKMKAARITVNALIACVVAGVVFIGMIRSAMAEEDFECQYVGDCKVIPPCPNPSGECDHCSSLFNWHEDCRRHDDRICVQDRPDSECGLKIEAVCDINNNCIMIMVTSTACRRLKCSDPGPGK